MINNNSVALFPWQMSSWHQLRVTPASRKIIYPGHHVHGPLARYNKLRVAHVPGMPGTFSSPPRVSDPDMNHGTCVMHVPWCIPGSLTSGFLLGRWRVKRSRYSRRMRNPQFYLSGKRPMMHPKWQWIYYFPQKKTWPLCLFVPKFWNNPRVA